MIYYLEFKINPNWLIVIITIYIIHAKSMRRLL
jgi:hypothetical protein